MRKRTPKYTLRQRLPVFSSGKPLTGVESGVFPERLWPPHHHPLPMVFFKYNAALTLLRSSIGTQSKGKKNLLVELREGRR